MCEAKSLIRVHSGAWGDFEPEISQVIPDVDARRHDASGKAAFGEQSNTSIGEFDPGSG
jgi:hypothetical protein